MPRPGKCSLSSERRRQRDDQLQGQDERHDEEAAERDLPELLVAEQPRVVVEADEVRRRALMRRFSSVRLRLERVDRGVVDEHRDDARRSAARKARMKRRSRLRTRAHRVASMARGGSDTQVPPPLHARTRQGALVGRTGCRSLTIYSNSAFRAFHVSASASMTASASPPVLAASRIADETASRERTPPEGLTRQLVDVLGLLDDDVVAVDLALVVEFGGDLRAGRIETEAHRRSRAGSQATCTTR